MEDRYPRLRKWMGVEKPFVPICAAQQELAGFPVYNAMGGLAVCRGRPDYYSFKYFITETDNVEAWRKKRDKMMQEADWDVIVK